MPIHFRPPKKTSGYFYICPKGMLEISFRRSSRQITNGFRVRTGSRFQPKGDFTMEFFNAAVDVMKTVVVALGGGLGVWGAVNLLEGYGGDNPSAKSQGMKQFMAN
jgi:hypothetical protein